MKPTTLYILICFLLVAILSCNSQKKNVESYEGFPLEVTDEYKIVWAEKFSNNMGMRYFYELKEPKVFRSIPMEGVFMVNSEGKLAGFTLSETYNLNGTDIPKGSRYERAEDDFYMIHLSKDTIIQGFPAYHKEDGFIFWSSNNVYFSNDGTLLGLGLSQDMIINDIPCNATKNRRTVEFYYNGNIRHCYLSENMEINGYPCKGGDENSELWLRQNGQLLSFFLSKDFSIDGKVYPKETQIIFDKTDKVHYLSGHLKFLSFYDNYMVHNIVLKDDIKVKGILFAKGSRIVYNKTGELNSARPKHNVVIEGVPCIKKEWVGFYPNGKLSWCKLSKKFEAEGKLYKKGTWLFFDEDGKAFIQR